MNFTLALLFACSSIAHQSTLQEELIQQSVSQGYHEDFIDLVELIYGKGFLSQGGEASIERMIAGTSIEEKKVLDIGSGLGGPALYLAEHYLTDITGLEPQRWLFERALDSLNCKKEELKGSIRFVLMDHPASLSQFDDEAFDLVISKESILHVPLEIKKAFFSEIARVLKPGGEIVIMDWMRTRFSYSQKTQKMMEMDGVAYHLLKPEEYRTLLEETGFSTIRMENISSETASYSQDNIEKIQKLGSAIAEKYGKEVYEYSIESWGYQRDAFATEELITGIFRATHP